MTGKINTCTSVYPDCSVWEKLKSEIIRRIFGAIRHCTDFDRVGHLPIAVNDRPVSRVGTEGQRACRPISLSEHIVISDKVKGKLMFKVLRNGQALGLRHRRSQLAGSLLVLRILLPLAE